MNEAMQIRLEIAGHVQQFNTCLHSVKTDLAAVKTDIDWLKKMYAAQFALLATVIAGALGQMLFGA